MLKFTDAGCELDTYPEHYRHTVGQTPVKPPLWLVRGPHLSVLIVHGIVSLTAVQAAKAKTGAKFQAHALLPAPRTKHAPDQLSQESKKVSPPAGNP